MAGVKSALGDVFVFAVFLTSLCFCPRRESLRTPWPKAVAIAGWLSIYIACQIIECCLNEEEKPLTDEGLPGAVRRRVTGELLQIKLLEL